MQYANLVEKVLPVSVWGSVMEITDQCASGLFLEPMGEAHSMYSYRKAILKEEFNAYTYYTKSKWVDGVGRFSTGVIVAVDPDKQTAAGFILYSRDFNCDDIVGIVGIAVRQEYRKQGIMTGMIEELRKSARDIGLSCSIDMVSLYHRLGFKILGEKGTQVRMGWGGSGGDMAVFGPGSFDKADNVQSEYEKLRTALGETYDQVADDYAKFVETEAKKVQTFIKEWQDESRP